MVVDGGYEETGDQICDHIRTWYGTETIDHVVSTHPDNDHISGLRTILRRMTVRELWVHIPYLHADRLAPLFASRRWTLDGLKAELRRAYPYVDELVSLARSQQTIVGLPFQGDAIGAFVVVSPTVSLYEGLLPQFRDTPAPDRDRLLALGHWLEGIGRRTARLIQKNIPENWLRETLREGGTTAAENESCVVLYGNLGSGGILLTADAGLRALKTSADYCDAAGFSLRSGLKLFQVPHHGSRNNISPSMLDRIIGPMMPEGQMGHTECIISAGAEDDTHPRQVVVNALVRRGTPPYVTRNGAIRFPNGVGSRQGWNTVQPLTFQAQVEAYD
jgi:beta-lactamase superfamily II metal-dependent hydrolase